MLFCYHFQFNWHGTAQYYLMIHKTFEDRFDAFQRQPAPVIKRNREYYIDITKVKFFNLNQEGAQCSSNPVYGPLQQKAFEVNRLNPMYFSFVEGTIVQIHNHKSL